MKLGLFFLLFSSCQGDDLSQDNDDDPDKIQTLLFNGTDPLELLNEGIPIDSFYGKIYEGGIIFYLSSDGTGLVVTTTDLSFGTQWGCPGNLINGADGENLGTGAQNTLDIVSDCTESGGAADLCHNFEQTGRSDWFLPSIDELNLMFTNLRDSGNLDGFAPDCYWSSTQVDEHDAHFKSFGIAFNSLIFSKAYDRYHVRAVRAC